MKHVLSSSDEGSVCNSHEEIIYLTELSAIGDYDGNPRFTVFASNLLDRVDDVHPRNHFPEPVRGRAEKK